MVTRLVAKLDMANFVFVLVLAGFSCTPARTSGLFLIKNKTKPTCRKNPNESQILQNGNADQFVQSDFNKSLPTKIYSHGWYGTPSAHGWGMRDGFLQKEDCNFIAVDWSAIAEGDFKVVASQTVPLVGEFAGSFIDFLVGQGMLLSSLHVVGFSVGSHVAGIAGYNVRSGEISRITGLDPPGYDFLTFDLPLRLDKSDAEFVDVIHTDGFTIQDPIGHVDFYPNGGNVQPGCPDPNDDAVWCNHNRAVYLFAESITSTVGFPSLLCDSWEAFLNGFCNGNNITLMGEPVYLTARGSYYLATKAEPPYAIGSGGKD